MEMTLHYAPEAYFPLPQHRTRALPVARLTDDTAQHPLVYLDESAEVDRFVDEIRGVREIAVDTEGASFHRYVDRIYLLQLTTGEQSAIIDPLSIGKPEGLGQLMEDPSVQVVFHDADYDLRLLRQDYGWLTRNVFDTRIAAQLIGLRSFGLAALLERYFGVKLDKKHQRADWSRRPLSEDMLAYASQDTRWLLQLRDRISETLAEKSRMAWAQEEFGLLEQVRWETENSEDSFMRMKGARDLTRRQLALLRELVRWRDEVSSELDRATFRVVGNEALLEIARRAPRSKDDLSRIKGMPRAMLENRHKEILSAVREGLAVPEASLPRFPRAPRWERDPDYEARVARLKAVRDQAALDLDLDPGVLCSRDRLEAVARRNPKSLEELAEVKELRDWQREVLGERFLAVL
jgi:ribonuclease D